MRKKRTLGFTLVELLVVIAILAILASVTVVGYMSFTKKAQESNDVVLVKQLNDLIIAESAEKPSFNVQEAFDALDKNGFNRLGVVSTTKDNTICYDENLKKFVIVEMLTGKVLFPEKENILNHKLYQPVSSEAGFNATTNYNPIYYFLSEFTMGDLDLNNISGLNFGNHSLVCGNLTINTSNENFYLENGYLKANNYEIHGKHINHEVTTTIYADTATIDVSATTYALRGTLCLNISLALNGDTVLDKIGKDAMLQVPADGTITVATTAKIKIDGVDKTKEDAVATKMFSIEGKAEYDTLEDAITAAANDDIINVRAGVAKVEGVTISKPISIIGSTTGKTVFVPKDGESLSALLIVFDYENDYSLFDSVQNVNIKNINFEGYTENDSVIYDLVCDDPDTIYIFNELYNLKVDNCSFNNIGRNGLYLGYGHYSITNCKFNTANNPDGAFIFFDGQYTLENAEPYRFDALVENCSFKDNVKTVDKWASSGITIGCNVDAKVNNCSFDTIDQAISVDPWFIIPVLIYYEEATDANSLVQYDATYEITNCKFSNNRIDQSLLAFKEPNDLASYKEEEVYLEGKGGATHDIMIREKGVVQNGIKFNYGYLTLEDKTPVTPDPTPEPPVSTPTTE